jgi:lysyl-tRNA synthetase class II
MGRKNVAITVTKEIATIENTLYHKAYLEVKSPMVSDCFIFFLRMEK